MAPSPDDTLLLSATCADAVVSAELGKRDLACSRLFLNCTSASVGCLRSRRCARAWFSLLSCFSSSALYRCSNCSTSLCGAHPKVGITQHKGYPWSVRLFTGVDRLRAGVAFDMAQLFYSG